MELPWSTRMLLARPRWANSRNFLLEASYAVGFSVYRDLYGSVCLFSNMLSSPKLSVCVWNFAAHFSRVWCGLSHYLSLPHSSLHYFSFSPSFSLPSSPFLLPRSFPLPSLSLPPPLSPHFLTSPPSRGSSSSRLTIRKTKSLDVNSYLESPRHSLRQSSPSSAPYEESSMDIHVCVLCLKALMNNAVSVLGACTHTYTLHFALLSYITYVWCMGSGVLILILWSTLVQCSTQSKVLYGLRFWRLPAGSSAYSAEW